MQSNGPQVNPGFPFAGVYLKRYEANLGRMPEVRAWRNREFDGGRPSGLKDYFGAHGFCCHCHGVGLAMNEDGMGYKAVGWDRDTQLFEKCDFCGGTGQLIKKPTMTSAIELHDSECLRIEHDADGNGAVILDAYVHRSAGVPGLTPGEGGEQTVRITIESMVVSGEMGPLPATIASGSLTCGGSQVDDLLPLPSEYAGDQSMTLVLRDDARTISVAGKNMSIRPEGEFRFIEMFDPR
jgi:hypothetical protein